MRIWSVGPCGTFDVVRAMNDQRRWSIMARAVQSLTRRGMTTVLGGVSDFVFRRSDQCGRGNTRPVLVRPLARRVMIVKSFQGVTYSGDSRNGLLKNGFQSSEFGRSSGKASPVRCALVGGCRGENSDGGWARHVLRLRVKSLRG